MSLTIEAQARALLFGKPVLTECIAQRTAAGVKRYGQRLEDNQQPDRAKAIHAIQESLDAGQYFLWLGEDWWKHAHTAFQLADDLQKHFGLTAAEIMAGGKQ